MGLKHFFRCLGQSLRSLKGTKASRRQLQQSRDYNNATYHRVRQDSLHAHSGYGSRRLKHMASSSLAFDRELEERLSITTARMEDICRQTFMASPASPLSISLTSNDSEALVECVPGTTIPLCDTGDAEEVVKVYARLMAAKRQFELAEQELKHVETQAVHAEIHGRRSASQLPPPPAHLARPKRVQPQSTWI